MDIITLSELNRTVLECLVRLNYLCSLGTDEAIKNSLNIHSSPRARNQKYIWKEFKKFKDKIDEHRYRLELFYENKEYNLQNSITRKSLSDIPKIRKVSETSIKNVERVLNYNGYSEELRNMFSEDVNTLVFAINLQIDIIRDYLRDNCSELEYNNLVELYDLHELSEPQINQGVIRNNISLKKTFELYG